MVTVLIIIAVLYLLATRVHVVKRGTQHSRTKTVKIGKSTLWTSTRRF